MVQKIVIENDSRQMQAAVLEDDRLAEYYVQYNGGSPVNGSIYCGTIESVLPGMQAAFVDIGWERNAYLALEDVQVGEQLEGCSPNISDLLKKGQRVVVQIKKEAVDLKGPKVSCKLTLSGRTMVLVPGKPYAAVSKKIRSAERRQELKDLTDEILSGHACGVIVRTAAEHAQEEELRKEFDWMLNRWRQLEKKIKEVQKPGLIQADMNLATKVIRECADEENLEGIYVSDYELYEELQQQILKRKIRFKIKWRETDLMELFQLKGEIHAIHKRKVWLKNGGYLVFDRTEALQVIDVNTGKFTGKNDFQRTILDMNLEAAEEIAKQIRLRNLSGMILIDFIDMQEKADQNTLLDAFERALKKDRVKTTLVGMTKLGLVEMTRKKERAPLSETMEQPCPFCRERGRVESAETVGNRLISDLNVAAERSEFPVLAVSCHVLVAQWLTGSQKHLLAELKTRIKKDLVIRSEHGMNISEYTIRPEQEMTCGYQLPVLRGEILVLKVEERHQEVPDDGIARIDGYIIQIRNGFRQIGNTVTVEVEHVMRTHAIAQIVPEVIS